MRKYLVLSVLLAALLWTISYVFAEEAVEFDPKVKVHLEEKYNMTKATREFAQSIEKLELPDLNLTSAKGLEYFTNVKELDLSGNVLTDSSFLKEMDKLEVVDLSYNQFETIDDLSSGNITYLNLRANRLSSIEFVHSLNNLLTLNLRSNNIEELNALESLDELSNLNIRGNRIKTLEPLLNLHKLENLNAENNQIHSIIPIINLPLNERLLVSGNNIDDIALIEDKLAAIEETDIEIGIRKPIFSAESGVYTEPFMLEIKVEEGNEIYYTLDGSTPNAQSIKYEGPIEISEKTMSITPVISNYKTSGQTDSFSFEPKEVKKAITIKAVSSYKLNKSNAREFSNPITKTFILDKGLFDSELPLISLTIEPRSFFDEYEGIYVPGVWYEEDSLWSGNYSLRGREHEKRGFMEFFNASGQIDFAQDIGLRINGRATRRFPQKSLRLYARSDYGQSRFYTDVFEGLEYNEFKKLLLRNSGQDNSSTLLRDGLMHELIKDLSVDVQAYQPLIVLINGEYWGIHNLREKFDQDYIDIKYNVRESELVLMKGFLEGEFINFDMKAGSDTDKQEYNDLLEFVRGNDLEKDSKLNYVESKVDIDNFFEYVTYQVYFANTDSFSNNLMLWRKRTDYNPDTSMGHDGRWRWMLFDLDWGMGFHMHSSLDYEGKAVDYNMIQHVLKDEERMLLFHKLMDNKQMQHKFIQKMLDLLNNNFETNNVIEKIDELAGNIRPEVEAHIYRWENIESVEQWEENLQVLYEFAEKRPDIVKQHLMEEFDLTEDDLRAIEESIQ